MTGIASETARYGVVVVGAGPAGIAAATLASEAGQRVLLIDQAPAPGGQIWRQGPGVELAGIPLQWLERLERSTTELRLSTTVVDFAILAPGDFQLDVVLENRGHSVRAGKVVIASGARELFLPFPGWTLPGVVGVGGAQALLKQGTSFRGKRVVVAGSGPLLLPAAAALARAGARVALVAEQAPRGAVTRFAASLWREPGTLVQAAKYRAGFLRTPYRPGTWVTAARGNGRCEVAEITNGRERREVGCDLLCTGYGLVPNTGLAMLAGCRLEGGLVAVDQEQETSIAGIYAAGEITGIGGVDLSLVEGMIAGLGAADREQDAGKLVPRREALRLRAERLRQAFVLRPELKALPTAETIVCRCEDVRWGALEPGWSFRQARLYTRVGMGSCQGRICGAALQHLHGWDPGSPGRPLEPVAVQVLLGHRA